MKKIEFNQDTGSVIIYLSDGNMLALSVAQTSFGNIKYIPGEIIEQFSEIVDQMKAFNENWK